MQWLWVPEKYLNSNSYIRVSNQAFQFTVTSQWIRPNVRKSRCPQSKPTSKVRRKARYQQGDVESGSCLQTQENIGGVNIMDRRVKEIENAAAAER